MRLFLSFPIFHTHVLSVALGAKFKTQSVSVSVSYFRQFRFIAIIIFYQFQREVELFCALLKKKLNGLTNFHSILYTTVFRVVNTEMMLPNCVFKPCPSTTVVDKKVPTMYRLLTEFTKKIATL